MVEKEVLEDLLRAAGFREEDGCGTGELPKVISDYSSYYYKLYPLESGFPVGFALVVPLQDEDIGNSTIYRVTGADLAVARERYMIIEVDRQEPYRRGERAVVAFLNKQAKLEEKLQKRAAASDGKAVIS